MLVRSWRSQMFLTPKEETATPFWRSSLEARSCPQAGWSTAMATTAASTAGSTRFLRFGLRRESSWRAISPPLS